MNNKPTRYSDTFEDAQDWAVEWHKSRFPLAEIVHVALKLCEEAGEVGSAVNALVGVNSATGKGDVVKECADVVIAVMVIMGRWFPEVSLLDEIEAKLRELATPGAHPASVKSNSTIIGVTEPGKAVLAKKIWEN
jgi:phosphoribosyl-ATP pyrophosphohydrolase